MAKHTVYFLSSRQHRSLMAEIWANRLGLSNWDIKSAAWDKPAITDIPIGVLKEVLTSLPDFVPRQYDAEEAKEADLVIALCDEEIENEMLTDLPAQKLIRWNIPNPGLHDPDPQNQWALYQEVCDQIAMQVKELEPFFRSH